MKLQEVGLDIQDFSFEEDKVTFTAKSITKDFVCEPGLRALAKDSVGRSLIWRHEHPMEYSVQHIYGKILDCRAEDGYMVTKYGVYNHTNEHKKFIDVLKKRDEIGKPLSISLRFRTYYNEMGEAVHFDVFEHSATPTPACKECKIIDLQFEESKMDEKELEETKNEIKKLEQELTKKDKSLEKLETTVEELKSELISKDESLEKATEEKDKLTEKILEFQDKLMEQSKAIKKLEKDREMDEIMPLVNELILEDGNEMQDVYLMVAKDDSKPLEERKEFFTKRLEKVKGQVMAVTETLEETAKKSFQEKELEMSEDEFKAKAKKALTHNKQLYNKLFGED